MDNNAKPEVDKKSLKRKRRDDHVAVTLLTVNLRDQLSLFSHSDPLSLRLGALSVSDSNAKDSHASSNETLAKKVRFNEECDYHYIEARPTPSVRRSPRLSSIRHQNSTNPSPTISSPRVLTPAMIRRDDDKLFEGWLNGSIPPPPLITAVTPVSLLRRKTRTSKHRFASLAPKNGTQNAQYIEDSNDSEVELVASDANSLVQLDDDDEATRLSKKARTAAFLEQAPLDSRKLNGRLSSVCSTARA
ncbi:hypothetical protein BGX21_006360 [Mortierella sp. AD011]|nr:hypothetical protein BGX20_006474 [Mortierella sp. AD010]KAF9399371.1 hypothetical protein BGX21_006360 [Mortierella sp. AD011]